MTFLASLDAFSSIAAQDSEAGPRGLQLADEAIESVINTIQAEQTYLDPDKFETRGHIAGSSFGGGDRAPALALHHTRAHAVTADTIRGVIEDLRTFQQACREVRQLFTDTDQDAAAELRAKQVAVSSLATGAWQDYGEASNRQAQEDHQHDTATEQPETEADDA